MVFVLRQKILYYYTRNYKHITALNFDLWHNYVDCVFVFWLACDAFIGMKWFCRIIQVICKIVTANIRTVCVCVSNYVHSCRSVYLQVYQLTDWPWRNYTPRNRIYKITDNHRYASCTCLKVKHVRIVSRWPPAIAMSTNSVCLFFVVVFFNTSLTLQLNT